MNGKVIGGILLIIGTSIGGGMLALPMATAAAGFLHSTLFFLAAWAVTVLAAFYILEVSLWLPEGTNLVSMARATLGVPGQVITWLSDLILLYFLLVAYMGGGANLVQNLFAWGHVAIAHWLSAVIFVVALGSILYFGVRAVDLANRSFMTLKLIAYALLVALISPHVNLASLASGQLRLLSGAIMIIITSFGYATIVPTLRTYLKGDVRALRMIIAVGSLIPLVCYLLWDLAVQGSLPAQGHDGLIAMWHSSAALIHLTNALSHYLHSTAIDALAHFFTTICIVTSFLGVSLCLVDFLTDGLKAPKTIAGRWLVVALALLPPLAVVLFYRGTFSIGLYYAGICCVVLLMLIPALMVWSGRYVKKISGGYTVIGGRTFVIIEVLIAVALVVFSIMQLW